MPKGTQVSELVYDHIESSSAHGLPNMVRAKSALGKFVWFILFVGGIAGLTWQIADRLDRYTSNEYAVKLEVSFSKEVPFPAVTICNMNPLRTSAIYEEAPDNLRTFLEAYGINLEDGFQTQNLDSISNNDKSEDMMDPKNDSNPPLSDSPSDSPADPSTKPRRRRQVSEQTKSTPMTPNDMTTEEVQSWESREDPEFFSGKAAGFQLRELIVNELSKYHSKDKIKLGHQLETMLLDCQWQGFPCAPSNFTTFFNSQFGNCYTFVGTQSGTLKSNHPGPINGLSLELYIEHDEYMQKIAETAGIVLVVHESDKMPLPEDDGIQISPGFNTAVGITQLIISRLSRPYGNCTREEDRDAEDVPPDYYKETFNVSGSLKTCERSCYQKAVIEICNCSDSSYPSPRDNPIKPCDTVNDTICQKQVQTVYMGGDIACNCYNPCREVTYIPSVSVAYWPSEVLKQKVYDKILKTNMNARLKLQREADPAEWLERNVAKVQIFFEEFNYQTITQSPSYTFGDLASDVGGQLGLWLGISILSVFEITEIIFAVMSLLWCGLKNSGKLKSSPGTPVQVIKPPIYTTMSENPGT